MSSLSANDTDTHAQDNGNGPVAGKTYWRSLEELEQTPEFAEMLRREFPDDDPQKLPPFTRRRFLQLMGASVALAGTTGCWRAEKILPFANRPEGRIPGNADYYATGFEIGGVVRGVVATSHDGRPTKIEGNPNHPMSLGATDAQTQGVVLELYDPDRSKKVMKRSGDALTESSWDAFNAELETLREELRADRGAGLAVLSGATSSPTLRAQRDRLKTRYPQATWYEYEAVQRDNERAGVRAAFGSALRPQYDLSGIERLLTLDDDLFVNHPAGLRLSREFADARRPEEGRTPRSYAVESNFSRTGATADHRLPVRSSEIGAFVAALGRAIASKPAFSSKPGHAAFTSGAAPSVAGERAQKFLDAVAEDLATHPGTCLVTVGAKQPADVHEAVHRLNALLGNVGKTVSYIEDPRGDAPTGTQEISDLVAAMKGGRVKTLFILGGNPVYDAPGDSGFAEALGSVGRSIHIGLFVDETARRSAWHLPRTHSLEEWGDGIAWDGTWTVCQPLIQPLYEGKAASEVLAILSSDDVVTSYELVRRTFRERFGADGFSAKWRRAVHDGVVADSAPTTTAPSPTNASSLLASARGKSVGGAAQGLEVTFNACNAVFDGRFANNGWLQELPDFMTKLAWDNAAIVAPETAKATGARTGQIARIEIHGKSIELPVYEMPGHALDSVTLTLGYGRKHAGGIGGSVEQGVDPVGCDVNPIRHIGAMEIATGAKMSGTGGKKTLALTQDHHAIDKIGLKGIDDRLGALYREGTLEEFKEHPDFAQHVVHVPPLKSLWSDFTYEGHKWGMTIDLDKCNGCDACVISCQAENNIPIVGQENVAKGREMHWLRIDRYFSGDPETPEVVGQPVTCAHCELAPCEQVCPVAATVHSDEGLNDMIYNRCVGTRYCANNCPYKVRRFNYFNYHKNLKDRSNDSIKMVFNPEVTVRNRGVMEKCTFCVQRIQGAKINAKNNRRPLEDGEIRTACQEACPTQAITFGDLNNEDSRVRKFAESDRSYAMLAELNIKPRLMYLAKIRNPNPTLEPASHGHGHGHDSHGGHDDHGHDHAADDHGSHG